jgi:hypothetical protein
MIMRRVRELGFVMVADTIAVSAVGFSCCGKSPGHKGDVAVRQHFQEPAASITKCDA